MQDTHRHVLLGLWNHVCMHALNIVSTGIGLCPVTRQNCDNHNMNNVIYTYHFIYFIILIFLVS